MAENTNSTQGNAEQRPTNEPQGGPITMGAQVFTAEQVAEAAAKQGGGAGATGAAGTAGAEVKPGDKAADAPKPGTLMVDGKPVKDGEYIPRDRYNQAVQQLRETRIAAGLDPDTGKAPDKAQAGGADAGKPKEFPKGQEPWAKDLLPLPRQDDKDDKGNDKYPDTASYLEALAEAKTHNKVVERFGRKALEDEAAAAARTKTQEAERNSQALHKFTNEAIPAALVKRGLLKEGALPQEIGPAFEAAMAPLKELPPMERQSTFIYNFVVKNAKSGADLLLAVAEEAKTPEGVAHILQLGNLSDNELINELIAMDRLVTLGLTIRGKPREAAGGAGGGAGGGKGKDLTSGAGAVTGQNIEPSPKPGGAGAAVDASTLTGAALFEHMEAERKAKNDALLKRFSGRN